MAAQVAVGSASDSAVASPRGLETSSGMLDKYFSELDPNNKEESVFSPTRDLRREGKFVPWSVLGDPSEFESELAEEQQREAEDAALTRNLSPGRGGVGAIPTTLSEDDLPEDVAVALKDDEQFAPAIYKAYQDCLEEKKSLLTKVEHLKMSRSLPLNGTATKGELQMNETAGSLHSTTKRGGTQLNMSTGTFERMRKQTIGDKIIEGSQVRALKEYEKFSSEWSDFKGKVSTKVGRLESDLVFERGSEFRRKKEELEMLELAIPTHERHGADQWTMSLRNNWTRYVPVGNIFSGLFCPVEDKPTIEYLEQITKPIHSVSSNTAKMQTTFGSSTLASRGRSWLDSKYLQRRRTQYSKNIAKVRQHSVGEDTISVIGESVESRVEDMANSAITIKDVEEKLSQTNPAVWELIRTNRQVRENFSNLEKQGTSNTATNQQTSGGGEAGEGKEHKEGPYLECSTNWLEFKNPVGKRSHQRIVLENTGTTAVKYCWAEKKEESIFDSDRNCNANKNLFFLSNPIGVILPGESIDFDFGFQSGRAGQFWSKWELKTIPKVESVDLLVLKGSASVSDFAEEERLKFISNLKEKIKERVTQNEMERIVNDVRESDKQEVRSELSPENQADRAMFVAANMSSSEHYFYKPEEFNTLKDLYEKHLAVDSAVNSENGEDTEDAKEDEPETAEGEESPVEEETKWDGSVSTIVDAVNNGKLSPDTELTIESVKETLDLTLTNLKIPSERNTIAYNSIYSLMLTVADAIEDQLFEEVANRAAENEAAQEEEGEEGEEGEGEGEKNESSETNVEVDDQEKVEEGAGADSGETEEGEAQEGTEEGSAEEEPTISEAKLAALDHASNALGKIDDAIAETCADLGKEFERQYNALKQRLDETSDKVAKEHPSWEMFQLSRTRSKVLKE